MLLKPADLTPEQRAALAAAGFKPDVAYEEAGEADRLRALIRVVVANGPQRDSKPNDALDCVCSYCGALDDGSRIDEARFDHAPDCPWPALVAEAEK